MALIRLQKYMSNVGICSRRKAEELILARKVKVNGELVTEMGRKVDEEKDKVEVLSDKYHAPKHKVEKFDNNKIYIALNKPVGYITSSSSDQGVSVLDLLSDNNCLTKGKKLETRVYPVGRLDKDSEGLVLLTNDGELTNLITHPRYEHEKEYEITIDGFLNNDARKILTTGMKITSGYVQGITIIKEFKKGRSTIITAILTEGKNRQIRKMFGNIGYRVMTLRRSRINKLTLGVLPVGKWKFVTRDKIV